MSRGLCRLPIVVTAVSLLAACGAEAEGVDQSAVGAVRADGGGPVVAATPTPGSDGNPGIGLGSASGGTGGRGGSATPSKKSAGIGGLTCPGEMTWSSGHDYEAGAFDSPTAPRTAREALRQALRPYGSGVDSLTFRRLPGQSPYESGKQVTFAGIDEDGNVRMTLWVEQGSKSKRWLPIGESGCG